MTVTYSTLYMSGFISEKVTRGGKPHIREILGGNMETHVAVYEEGLRGAKPFKGGKCPLSPPPPLKETRHVNLHDVIQFIFSSLFRECSYWYQCRHLCLWDLCFGGKYSIQCTSRRRRTHVHVHVQCRCTTQATAQEGSSMEEGRGVRR